MPRGEETHPPEGPAGHCSCNKGVHASPAPGRCQQPLGSRVRTEGHAWSSGVALGSGRLEGRAESWGQRWPEWGPKGPAEALACPQESRGPKPQKLTAAQGGKSVPQAWLPAPRDGLR